MTKRMRFGLVGATLRGVYLAWELEKTNEAELAAASDPTPRGAARLQTKMKRAVPVSKDYRELLKDASIDSVVVASPDRFHEEHAIACMESGKHVYLEKPMAISTEGCSRIINAWRRSKTKLMVGFNLRAAPIFGRMRWLIQNGEVGDVRLCWARYFVGRGANYYFEGRNNAIVENCNSLLLQKASHDLDMIQWLTGVHAIKVAALGSRSVFGGDKPNDLHCRDCRERVRCLYTQNVFDQSDTEHDLCAFRKEIDVEDAEMLIMQMENGVQASYQQCMYAPTYRREYCVIGTKGRIEGGSNFDEIHLWYTSQRREHRAPDRIIDMRNETQGSHGGGDVRIVRDFVDYILYDKAPTADPYDGYWSVATGCAATDSLRNGGVMREIEPPPVKRAGKADSPEEKLFTYT